MKFKQIVTGEYQYFKNLGDSKNSEKMKSHCIYALDDKGDIYKFIPSRKQWIKIEEIEIYDN